MASTKRPLDNPAPKPTAPHRSAAFLNAKSEVPFNLNLDSNRMSKHMFSVFPLHQSCIWCEGIAGSISNPACFLHNKSLKYREARPITWTPDQLKVAFTFVASPLHKALQIVSHVEDMPAPTEALVCPEHMESLNCRACEKLLFVTQSDLESRDYTAVHFECSEEDSSEEDASHSFEYADGYDEEDPLEGFYHPGCLRFCSFCCQFRLAKKSERGATNTCSTCPRCLKKNIKKNKK